MDIGKRFWLPLAFLLVCILQSAAIGEPANSPGRPKAASAAADSTRQLADEDWLKTVWGQIDSLIIEEDFELQETVVASGVRGAEITDVLLDQYYFKGGQRYSAAQLIEQVVGKLERQMDQRRRAVNRPKLRYLSAICYDILGQYDQAREYYTQIVEKNPKSGYAAPARQRLEQLGKMQ